MTTVDGEAAWQLVQRGWRQLRAGGMGRPLGLDLGTLMRLGEADGLALAVLARLLPAAEAGMMAGMSDRSGGGLDGKPA